ncbi:MAG: AmmeMemoRadiSam system protein B [Dongiaceae bacterium]
MIEVRQPAVAGSFYPGSKAKLAEAVQGYLAEVSLAPATDPPPKALIVPHAGYVYSGAVAATAYARLTGLRDVVKRVVLIGPAHYVPLRGLAASGARAFATPLGEVPVDCAAIDGLRDLRQVTLRDDAHEPEHSLEVQLPLLQAVLHDFAIVPLVVGDATYDEVREAIDRLWDGPETLIVISSDLSHYHPYETACRLDAETAAAIVALDADAIGEERACGRVPIGGLLRAASGRGLHVVLVDLRNSGDTAGPRSEVVGYGSFLFT